MRSRRIPSSIPRVGRLIAASMAENELLFVRPVRSSGEKYMVFAEDLRFVLDLVLSLLSSSST
jgi:hypothetical protein